MKPEKDKPAIDSVKDGISNKINLASFSEEANTVYQAAISKFVDDLYEESIKAAGRHEANQVSDNDVNRARQYLYSYQPTKPHKRGKDVCNLVGPALFGAAVAIVVELSAGIIPPTALSFTITFISATSGLLLSFFALKE